MHARLEGACCRRGRPLRCWKETRSVCTRQATWVSSLKTRFCESVFSKARNVRLQDLSPAPCARRGLQTAEHCAELFGGEKIGLCLIRALACLSRVYLLLGWSDLISVRRSVP